MCFCVHVGVCVCVALVVCGLVDGWRGAAEAIAVRAELINQK